MLLLSALVVLGAVGMEVQRQQQRRAGGEWEGQWEGQHASRI